MVGKHMLITAKIRLPETELLKVFKAEEKVFKTGRASYDVRRNKDTVVISITAKDLNAFKSVVLSIIKLIDIWFSIKQMIRKKLE